jgi:hypothetical protein
MSGLSVTAQSAALDHPWEQHSPLLWRVIELVAAILVVGSLLTAGIAFPLVLPVAVAGAARIAVRRARRQPVHPLGDALAGIREDLPGIAVLMLAVGLAVAPTAWAVGLAGPSDTDLGAGVRLGLISLAALGFAPLVIGSAIASATVTPARSIPFAALAMAVRAPLRSAAIVAAMIVGLVPIATAGGPAVLPVWIGAAYLIATRIAIGALAAEPGNDGDV